VYVAHFVNAVWRNSPAFLREVARHPRSFYHYLVHSLSVHVERGTFHHAKVIVAVSDLVRENLIELGVPSERIRVVVNGVDTERFCPGPPDRVAFGLPPDVPMALFVGDIATVRKNLDTVLRALVGIPRLHLAVAGSTRGSRYPALARRLGLADRVHFLGTRDDMPLLMRSVDMVVLVSHYEPFGLVVLEAMASGIPVVTARTVGAAPLVEKGGGMTLPDPTDTAALTSALATLVAKPRLRAALGSAGRAIAEQYAWRDASRTYASIYEELAG
jgi:glycosyltransferase involved in cell wall biosynthesis